MPPTRSAPSTGRSYDLPYAKTKLKTDSHKVIPVVFDLTEDAGAMAGSSYRYDSPDSDVETIDPPEKTYPDLIKEFTKERDDLRLQYEESQKSHTVERKKGMNTDISASSVPEHVLSSIIQCKVCLFGMDRPYTLSCGHTYCDICLEAILSGASKAHKKLFPQCNSEVTANLFKPIQAVDITTLKQLSAGNRAENRPNYRCPGCRAAMTAPPVRNYDLKAVVEALMQRLVAT
ncbi:hypothetical protein OF83DRAFT_1154425 [Amylostereum chailletii]|nr:hypothetical protein OF83DRAFT_1154425 [Amylostereum chailletii]